MRERIQCIVIQDKKILLVKDEANHFFYPPGGKLEEGETHEDCILREIDEEIQAKASNFKYYLTYDELNYKGEPQREHTYFIAIDKEPSPGSEVVALRWADIDEIESGTIPFPEDLYENLFEKLKKEKYL